MNWKAALLSVSLLSLQARAQVLNPDVSGGQEAWLKFLNDQEVLTEEPGLYPVLSSGGDKAQNVVGHFLRNISIEEQGSAPLVTSSWPGFEPGLRLFRLVQGSFPDPSVMKYHFDGLATILRFDFNATHLSWRWSLFESGAADDFEKCIFVGNGVGPTRPGRTVCFTNPGVNLLPIDDQLWLTIDTLAWGRVDPDTLETIPHAHVGVDSMILNAHPACDRTTSECFVEHPCSLRPYQNTACISRLVPNNNNNSPADTAAVGGPSTLLEAGSPPLAKASPLATKSPLDSNMGTEVLSNASMPHKRLIQHSHSLCATPGFVIAKLDNFIPRPPGRVVGDDSRHGILRYVHQQETTEFMVMDRQTLKSSVIEYTELESGDGDGSTAQGFINNHFWNCYEDPLSNGTVVIVETVATTKDYLDQYFAENLEQPTDWPKLFQPALRCKVPAAAATSATSTSTSGLSGEGQQGISCAPLGPSLPYFDYPTFNPQVKGKPYSYFYAIAAADSSSRWFDKLIKVDASGNEATVVAEWTSPGIFLTEADFVPGWSGASADSNEEDSQEDLGTLMTVAYNATSDSSFLAAFDARTLSLIEQWELGGVVPFHAHGIVCPSGSNPLFEKSKGCYSNP